MRFNGYIKIVLLVIGVLIWTASLHWAITVYHAATTPPQHEQKECDDL